ncbi:heat-inducible transcriptional repressor HrcA [Bifidobacterium sp. SMB2]|uniref:Heat-inducible transcription repressor HrcA n=1 Tax=Bifidobacterium saimiriisciurei TaxID=2661627 RepID=A0ABX0CB19_9BIFI|nr:MULTISPECIES: heat-inducible transcriptional repressor HrcA [Bifidobacterium]NEG96863.1 heat-inducible transcriptional repressor HrcA [Bifidobacterium sp. SMB2]NEH11607.1 heat-inducible transcriptional repressor HrcA [Bifidobacterium saimiriisciurei]
MTNERRMSVLRAVIEDYIRTHEPVGSAALTRGHDLGVSSATVRNDMAALEDEGYLIQPHTSAGRIPTEKGYRYFVDKLATVVPLSKAQKRGIRSFLSGSVNLDDTLRRSARLLAQITGQVAVVASPSLARSALRHLEMVPVSSATILVVVITDTGRVEQRTIIAAERPGDDTLSRISAKINTACTGRSLRRAGNDIRMFAGDESSPINRSLLEALARVCDELATQEQSSNLYMAGTSQLTHRQVVDMNVIAPLFDALEEQAVIMRLMTALSEVTQSHGVGIAIGSETHTPGLMNASVVTSGYGQSTADDDGGSGQPSGTAEPVAFIGSIGPTHMDYATTISAVRAVAKYLTEFMANEENSPDDDSTD